MENEMNQGMNQQAGEGVPPLANQQIPPCQQQPGEAPPWGNQQAPQPPDPGPYPYPPYHHHHKFLGKKVSVSLWKILLAGFIAVLLAFNFRVHAGRMSGMMGRIRKMAPYMMQVPNNGQGGYYSDDNGGAWGRRTYQIPNNGDGGYTNPKKGSFQYPSGQFQFPNGKSN